MEVESETSSSDHLGKVGKYQLNANLKNSLVDLPEALAFIEKLQKTIERLKKRLKKLSAERTKTIESSTQTEPPQQVPQSITEEIAEAAEQAVLKTGMVYEESSGLYYDCKTGYYYNAEYGLYYDGTTGTYMTYDAANDTYSFYSKVDVPADTLKKGDGDIERRRSHRRKRDSRERDADRRNRISRTAAHRRSSRYSRSRSRSGSTEYRRVSHAHSRRSLEDVIDLEEGECSDDGDAVEQEEEVMSTGGAKIALSEADYVDSDSSDAKDADTVTDDITKKYPPCIRIIVEESNIPHVRKGGLFMVPYTGGTLGREGTSHAILLPDINVSKHHLQFRYDEQQKRYFVCDLGSRNGTLLNGTRMAPSKQESDPMELVHGSKLQIGGTILHCHIHTGAQTCGHCEPGLVQADDASVAQSNAPSKSEQHKKELKQLRKKFGISQYDSGKVEPGPGYTNRAQSRRDTVGSFNPYEKTQRASLTESIPAQNKGFKMLAKMGWTEGTALGKDGTGRTEPVELVSNTGTSGIGSASTATHSLPVNVANQAKPTTMLWLKTKERFDKLPDTTTIRDTLDDDHDTPGS